MRQMKIFLCLIALATVGDAMPLPAGPVSTASLNHAAYTSKPIPAGIASLGELISVNGLLVRPLEVIQDNRCYGSCYRSGNFILRTEVIADHSRQIHDLYLHSPLQIAGGSLTLTDVKPDKGSDAKIDPRLYRFAFDFSANPNPPPTLHKSR